jgi:Tat protein secretion system quality control protein TatD with DNase activity
MHFRSKPCQVFAGWKISNFKMSTIDAEGVYIATQTNSGQSVPVHGASATPDPSESTAEYANRIPAMMSSMIAAESWISDPAIAVMAMEGDAMWDTHMHPHILQTRMTNNLRMNPNDTPGHRNSRFMQNWVNERPAEIARVYMIENIEPWNFHWVNKQSPNLKTLSIHPKLLTDDSRDHYFGEMDKVLNENQAHVVGIGEFGFDHTSTVSQPMQLAVMRQCFDVVRTRKLFGHLHIRCRTDGKDTGEQDNVVYSVDLENNIRDLTLTKLLQLLVLWEIGDLDIIWHMARFNPDSQTGARLLRHFEQRGGNLLFGINLSICRKVDDEKFQVTEFRRMVQRLPLADLVTETDSPHVAISGGEVNSPANIPMVICGISHIKQVPIKLVIEAVNNTLKQFLNHQRIYRPISLKKDTRSPIGELMMQNPM